MKFNWRMGALLAITVLAGWSLQRMQTSTPVLAQGRGNGGEHGRGEGHGHGHASGRGNGHQGDQAGERDDRDQGDQAEERDHRDQGENRDEDAHHRHDRVYRRDGRVASIFDPRSRDEISRYYHGTGRGLPPGLAKRNGDLPPGLQRQLERNGTLPPGLQRQVQPFPYSLSRRLPRVPTYYRRGMLGNDAVIYDTRTQRIVDVIHAVLNR